MKGRNTNVYIDVYFEEQYKYIETFYEDLLPKVKVSKWYKCSFARCCGCAGTFAHPPPTGYFPSRSWGL